MEKYNRQTGRDVYMTPEDKRLLIKDLLARLPYGVRVEIDGYCNGILKGIDGDTISTDRGINYPLRLVKPYLRPMSSMTDEEKETYESFITNIATDETGAWELTDWLNAHYFDYRGNLIPNGLAIEAPNGMYNIK